MFRKGADHLYRSSLLEQFDWLDHGFGTRASEGWLDQRPSATLQQVHSATVIEACAPADRFAQGDALVAQTPGLWIGVRTADCYPVILADAAHRAVGVVHAGWRGTAAEIVLAAIGKMGAAFGTRIADLCVAVGPGIGGCCYEVGPEVADRFRRWEPNIGRTVDICRILSCQLADTGLTPERVDLAGLCTRCLAGEFHSWRREGEQTGRMVSGVAIKTRRAPEETGALG